MKDFFWSSDSKGSFAHPAWRFPAGNWCGCVYKLLRENVNSKGQSCYFKITWYVQKLGKVRENFMMLFVSSLFLPTQRIEVDEILKNVQQAFRRNGMAACTYCSFPLTKGWLIKGHLTEWAQRSCCWKKSNLASWKGCYRTTIRKITFLYYSLECVLAIMLKALELLNLARCPKEHKMIWMSC